MPIVKITKKAISVNECVQKKLDSTNILDCKIKSSTKNSCLTKDSFTISLSLNVHRILIK